MGMSRIGWAVWAMVPVGALAFHYGPGQKVSRHDAAAALQASAAAIEREAAALQEQAYARHLACLDARKAMFLLGTPEAEAAWRAANAAQEGAFQAASAAWRRVADAYGAMQDAAEGADAGTLRRLRWSRARALVRAGDVWTGIGEFEDMLAELDESGSPDAAMVGATREELASAYYYGARLMRLSGEPAEEWRIESGKARQHFRYLAEQARARNVAPDAVQNHERNVELVLNLEQEGQYELEGKPLPRESPLGRTGNRPGNRQGKRKQPPQQRDARGAGGAEDIFTGW